MELVLMDAEGARIHAYIKTLIYKFMNVLKEGKVYSIHGFEVTKMVVLLRLASTSTRSPFSLLLR